MEVSFVQGEFGTRGHLKLQQTKDGGEFGGEAKYPVTTAESQKTPDPSPCPQPLTLTKNGSEENKERGPESEESEKE